MANRYFSQYLLNKGVLTPENAGEMLAKSLNVTPELSVLALEKGLINSEQALELAESAGFIRAALGKNYLTALQLDDLKKAVPERSACLGQVLLDEGVVGLSELAKLFEESAAPDCHPVETAVHDMLVSWNADENDYGYIKDYVELFLGALQRFMNTDALIIQGGNSDGVDTTYLTYQSMGGALRLTVGCRMNGDVMLSMAKRFSDEVLTEVDEMAIDCIEEFCNVLNGLYIVNMSGKSQDMDLDMPQTVENGEPGGDSVFQLRVETEFGGFVLYLSMDGFVFEDSKPLRW